MVVVVVMVMVMVMLLLFWYYDYWFCSDSLPVCLSGDLPTEESYGLIGVVWCVCVVMQGGPK